MPRKPDQRAFPVITFRLTDLDHAIITGLQAATGANRTGVVRLAIREAALTRGISLPTSPEKKIKKK